MWDLATLVINPINIFIKIKYFKHPNLLIHSQIDE